MTAITHDGSRSGTGYRKMLRESPDYRDYRRDLTPRWGLAWLDLAADWVLLAAVVALAAFTQRALGGWWVVVVVPALSVVVGLLVHRIGMFTHEGAHLNLAPSRRSNDVLTNAFSAALILTDVRTYRPIHLAHHRHLGTPRDTEVTYWSRLGPAFLVRNLTGITALDALRRRRDLLDDGGEPAPRPWVPVLGAVFHLVVIVTALALGYWWVAVVWVAGAFSLHPTFNSLRQALEHRSEDADGAIDYSTVEHGAVTRMFTRSRLSGLLGGVGFDHHLLHHWEPGISYTRLPELLRYLLEEDRPAEIIEQRNGTYTGTLRRLWGR